MRISNEKHKKDNKNKALINTIMGQSPDKYKKLVYSETECSLNNNEHVKIPTHVSFNQPKGEDEKKIKIKISVHSHEISDYSKKTSSKIQFKETSKPGNIYLKEKTKISLIKKDHLKTNSEINIFRKSDFGLIKKNKIKSLFSSLIMKSIDTLHKNSVPEKLNFITMSNNNSTRSVFDQPMKNRTIDPVNIQKQSDVPPFKERVVEKTKIFKSNNPIENHLFKFRNKLINRGGKSILSLSKQFKIFDTNNDKTLSFSEFLNAIKLFKIDLSLKESEEVFNHFDKDGNFKIDFEEFLANFTDEMNSKRENLVVNIFNLIDRENRGFINLDTIKNFYNAKCHPDVISKKKSEEQILNDFLQLFKIEDKSKKTKEPMNLDKESLMKKKSIFLNYS